MILTAASIFAPSTDDGMVRSSLPKGGAPRRANDTSKPRLPVPAERFRTMTTPNEADHTEHLAQAQDHFRWRHDHLEALTILKRAEAAIFAYQARIVEHESAIARHEEQIAHGSSEASGRTEHAHFTKSHPHEHNDGLFAAIRALLPHLERDA